MTVTDLSGVTAALAAIRPSPKLDAVVAPPAPEPQASTGSPPDAAAATSVEPKLVKMVQPEYPQEAMMRGLEGWVEVSLQVSPSGDVVAPRVEQSSRGRMFNRAALNAVQQWKYEPRSDGTTSERMHVRLKFTQSN
jgi:protein TonB